jgi:hypothetical protein
LCRASTFARNIVDGRDIQRSRASRFGPAMTNLFDG